MRQDPDAYNGLSKLVLVFSLWGLDDIAYMDGKIAAHTSILSSLSPRRYPSHSACSAKAAAAASPAA